MQPRIIGRVPDFPEGKCKKILIDGKPIAVFNISGTFYAIQDNCPHKGTSLSEGDIDGTTVTCSGHGWMFSVKSGNCLTNPTMAQAYNVRVEGDNVLLDA